MIIFRMNSVSTSSSSSVATRDIIESATSAFRRSGFGEIPIDTATLENLFSAMCCEISNLSVVSEKTVPPQQKFNQTVVSGLTQLGFQDYLAKFTSLLSFSDEAFAEHLFTATIGNARNPSVGKRADYPTDDEFSAALTENKPWCVMPWVREKTLDDVPFLELVRATRHLLGFWVFRVFGTRDLSETRTVTVKGKQSSVSVCNPDRVEFRIGTRRIASERTCDFATALCDTYDYIVRFSANLSEFNFIKTAAQTCKQEREAFKTQQRSAKIAQYSSQQSVQNTTKSQAKPSKPSKPSKPTFYSGPVASAPKQNIWSDRKVVVDAKSAERVAQRAMQDAIAAEAIAADAIAAEALAKSAAEAVDAATFTMIKGSSQTKSVNKSVDSAVVESLQSVENVESDDSESAPAIQPLNQKGLRFQQTAQKFKSTRM